MTAAALLTLATTASAGTIKVPQEYLGSWCNISSSNEYLKKYNDCNQPSDALTIYSDHLDGWEVGCRFTAVKTWFDPTIIRNTKEWGVKVSLVEARCEGIDRHITWKEQFTIHASKGALTIKYQERRK